MITKATIIDIITAIMKAIDKTKKLQLKKYLSSRQPKD